MASQTWVNLLNAGAPWQTTQGTSLATATTATISPQAPSGQDFILPGQPGGLQWYQGMSLHVFARGSFTTGGTGSNLTVFLAAGVSGTLGTTLSTTTTIALGTGSLTAQRWGLEGQIDVVTLTSAAAAFLSCEGAVSFSGSATPAIATASGVTVGLPYTAVNGSTLSPYTTATAIGLRATLSAAYGSIQCDRFLIEQVS
jgi:hypothetical protein